MTKAEVNRLYAGINGYDPYKISATVVDNISWLKYVGVALFVIALRFLCCA
jgi:hypothetical protein